MASVSTVVDGAVRKINQLVDLSVQEVSAVDRPANKRRFLVIKRAEPTDPRVDAILAKIGDKPGHPFRGNQYTHGEGGGGAEEPEAAEKPPTAEELHAKMSQAYSKLERAHRAQAAEAHLKGHITEGHAHAAQADAYHEGALWHAAKSIGNAGLDLTESALPYAGATLAGIAAVRSRRFRSLPGDVALGYEGGLAASDALHRLRGAPDSTTPNLGGVPGAVATAVAVHRARQYMRSRLGKSDATEPAAENGETMDDDILNQAVDQAVAQGEAGEVDPTNEQAMAEAILLAFAKLHPLGNTGLLRFVSTPEGADLNRIAGGVMASTMTVSNDATEGQAELDRHARELMTSTPGLTIEKARYRVMASNPTLLKKWESTAARERELENAVERKTSPGRAAQARQHLNSWQHPIGVEVAELKRRAAAFRAQSPGLSEAQAIRRAMDANPGVARAATAETTPATPWGAGC